MVMSVGAACLVRRYSSVSVGELGYTSPVSRLRPKKWLASSMLDTQPTAGSPSGSSLPARGPQNAPEGRAGARPVAPSFSRPAIERFVIWRIVAASSGS